MKSAILSVLATSVLVADARSQVKAPVTSVDPNYYLQGVRGLWTGYESGFYKNTKKNAGDCLNDETTQNIIKMVDFFESGMDMSHAFNFISEGMQVFGNLETSCSLEGSVEDLWDFCDDNADHCTGASILSNLTSNMFVLIGKLTEVSEVIKSFPAATSDDLYTQTNTIGNDIGTTLRIITGFTPK